MRTWVIDVPDLLVFLSIYGFGVFTGIILFGVMCLLYCSDGGIIQVSRDADKKDVISLLNTT